MKKLNYKKLLIFGIPVIVFLSILITLILFFTSNSKTTQTSQTRVSNNIEQIIPNVTTENTVFKLSDMQNKVESANISASNRLSGYNLYYCIKFDNNANNEIQNEDYLVFNDLILVLEENCTILFKYESNGNYSKDAYEIKISNIEIDKKENSKTEKVDDKILEKEKVDEKTKNQSTAPYFIRVNYKANVVTIYSKDDEGNYTVPYKAMVCSCGTYTPKSGTYKTSNKYVWRPLINNVYGHYATRIVNKILFHSVPYTAASNDALEYWEYDKLGQTASEGCVRLTVQDAKWIYNNCPSGTMVEFYADSNPGPLGKPSAQKISSNVECRDWDPTDTKEGNPWHTYKEEKNEVIEEPVISETTPDTDNNITTPENNNSISNDNSITNNNTEIDNNNNNNVSDNTIIDNTSESKEDEVADEEFSDDNVLNNNQIENNTENSNNTLTPDVEDNTSSNDNNSKKDDNTTILDSNSTISNTI